MSSSIIAPNKIKHALKNGQSVVGTMVVEIRQPSVMQLLANAGYDFVIIDNEHGAFNPETLADLSRTALLVGITPIVRVPDLAYPYLAQTLDGGAQGIMLPRVYNVEQVRQAVDMMKYPPLGNRGNALVRGYTAFKGGSPAEAMPKANEETMLIVQVETKEAVENIKEIVTTPGVDAVLIGPNDLAISLGVTGQFESPILHDAIETVIYTCQQYNVYPALHINNLDLGRYWVNKGMRILSMYSEVGLLMHRGGELTKAAKETFNS